MRPIVRRSAAALLLALGALDAAAADEFGTLFTSPEERARLDRLRRGEPVVAATAAPVRHHKPAVTGYVQRSDGRNTVWVDGRPIVVATPDATLEPEIVEPHPSGRVLRIEEPRKGSR